MRANQDLDQRVATWRAKHPEELRNQIAVDEGLSADLSFDAAVSRERAPEGQSGWLENLAAEIRRQEESPARGRENNQAAAS